MKKIGAVVAMALVAFVALRAPSRADDEKKDRVKPLLAAIGGVSASSTYFTFGFVGSVSDGFVKGTYKAAQAKELLGEAAHMMERNAGQMKTVEKDAELGEADAKTVHEFAGLFEELHEYAKSIQDFVDDKDQEHAKTVEANRQKTWKHLKKVLGIKGND